MNNENGTLNEQGIWEQGWIAGNRYARRHSLLGWIKYIWRRTF